MNQGFQPMVVQIRTRATAEPILAALDEVLVRRWNGQRTGEPGAWAVYRTGSAVELRLLGVYSAKGARRFPLVIRVDIAQDVAEDLDEDGGDHVVRLIIEGAEGPYLIYPKRAQKLWHANVERISTQIGELLAG